MSVRVEVFDGVTPMLEKILELSYTTALESLSVAGNAIREEARSAMRSKTHNWFQKMTSEGRMVLYRNPNKLRELGLRISHATGQVDDPESMQNFITSYLMEKKLTVVVGGRHRAFRPKMIRDGKIVGTLGRVNAVGRETHAILHMMNFGEAIPGYEADYNKGGERKGYHFMEEGFSHARGRVADAMTKRYESLLHKAVDRANVKIVKRTPA
jgi:hypothetical protein